MSQEIIPFRPHGSPAPVASVNRAGLYGALLADADCDSTRAGRVKDVAAIARYLGASPDESLALLVSGTPGQANTVALGFKAHQLAAKLAPNTINRRLSTMRRAVKIARRLGLIDWSLDVELLRSESYRDTTGPGLDGWRSILAVAIREAAGGSPSAVRDLAIIRCLHDRGLRSVEVLRLDLADVDIEGKRLAVIGKGKLERAWLSINGPTADALAAWVKVRGSARGPLMVRTDRGAKGSLSRISHVALWKAVRKLGSKAGLSIPSRPHGLRHQGVTRLLDLTGGDVRRVRKFSRHARLDTVAVYDDARQDFGGQLSDLLGEDRG